MTFQGEAQEVERADYYVAQMWFTSGRPSDMLAKLERLLSFTTEQRVVKLSAFIRRTAKARSKPSRHAKERFVNVMGGTHAQVEKYVAFAKSLGVRLKCESGPLLRSTATVGKGGQYMLTDMPFSTGQGPTPLGSGLWLLARQR